jgi:hypothetical protein
MFSKMPVLCGLSGRHPDGCGRELSDLPACVGSYLAVGDASFTGKFGAASYPQRGQGGSDIFLTSASCSTSQQAIDFAR